MDESEHRNRAEGIAFDELHPMNRGGQMAQKISRTVQFFSASGTVSVTERVLLS